MNKGVDLLVSKIGGFKQNPDKPLQVQVEGRNYLRVTIQTHFITTEDNYTDLVKEYVIPEYKEGDVLILSEKIISITQNRLVHKDQMNLSFLAKFLSKFVHITPAGQGVGNPYKMQVAINSAGPFRVLIAALAAAITKPFGIKGVFYKVVGHDVWGIDGFNDLAYEYYDNKGILTPRSPDKVCNEIGHKFNIKAVIADANDLNVEILGKSSNVNLKEDILQQVLADNPAGQKNEQTPIILIREV